MSARFGTRLLLGLWLIGGLPSASASGTPPVVALGKLRPGGGITRVAAPYSLQGPAVIGSIHVASGQKVTQGELLARTHIYASTSASLAEAIAQVEVRRAALAVVESGLKPGEIVALAADAEAERANFLEATQVLTRAQDLLRANVVSTQELDTARNRWLAASNRVLAATHRLTAGAEVRAVDIQLARAELAAAQATADRIRVDLEQTEIRAPYAGVVLAVHARAGEMAPNGVLDLGRTDAMEVLAEVYESDIQGISEGQRAEIRGEVLRNPLAATVLEVGRQVRPNRLMNPDPAAFADNRVVEVILKLENSLPVAALSGAMVRVHFLP